MSRCCFFCKYCSVDFIDFDCWYHKSAGDIGVLDGYCGKFEGGIDK